MLFEHLPSELLLEIFSYVHPADLYIIFLPLANPRLTELISHLDLSLDLISTSYSRFQCILTRCSSQQIVFLRLTNRYSHYLLIKQFFSSPCFHPENFLHLRSLHLDDCIGNELDCLPPNLDKLYVKFHKKAKYAIQFYRLALQSTTLKQCYLIGGYAFDYRTCSPISSTTIEHLHMAMKTFPNDLIVLLQALPNLIQLKTRFYSQSLGIEFPSTFTSPLTHLNLDMHDSGISLSLFNVELLSHLPRLQSFVYQYSGKTYEDIEHLLRLSNQFKRIQFIRKGLSINIDPHSYSLHGELVTAIQEINSNRTIRQSTILHTIPYPDRILSLPFIQWNTVDCQPWRESGIYDRVKHVRLNLSDLNRISNFPQCRHVSQLTLISTNESNNSILSLELLSSFVCLSSIRHLIINTSTSSIDFNQLLPFMSIQTLEISWSQFRLYSCWSNIQILSLLGECVSWRDINYLIKYSIPRLEHLQINVTTSDECQKILDILLSPTSNNQLISMKICICQTLSDQSREDLEPRFCSSQWIQVQYQMDQWYLYIWK